MTDLSVLDRLRIERVVWTLDQRLIDLPRATRIAHRRDLRTNLVDAAGDVGTTAALRDLGDASALAEDYQDAALGSGPRASYSRAGIFFFTTVLVLTSLFFDAAEGFGAGVLAADPDASGTFRWSGIPFLQTDVIATASAGDVQIVGGAFTPLTYLLLLVGAVLVGRLWRALPRRRRPAGQAG